jgi:hypothetical protein
MPVDYADALDLEASDWGEADWEADFSEARGRTPARPRQYTPPAATKGYVTNAVFQTALDKVRADVATNARGIAHVGSQHDALSKRTRAEVKSIRAEITRTRDETRNTLQMLAILPLLSAGGSTQAEAPGGTGTVTVSTPPDSMSQVLPLLMLSGFGGTSGSGGSSSGGGMDSGMMLMVALMSAQPRSR